MLAGALVAGAAQALPVDQPPRWVKADDLRVRAGPGTDEPVVGMLQRGTQVVLKSPDPLKGFCAIEGDGQFGYVACQYLSVEPVSRPHAGLDGVPSDRRWVTGTGVVLRAAPSRDAQVVSRLVINRQVKLLRSDAGAGYCEVQPLDRVGVSTGSSGYTACQYLGLEELLASQAAGPDADPVRAFWRAPNWDSLETYARALAASVPEEARAGPWPRDEQLERMKAHLAQGLKGHPPRALDDWAALKALAAAHAPALLSKAGREGTWTAKDDDAQQRARRAVWQMQSMLGLYGPLHDTISSDGGAQRVVSLVQALELPKVRPSLFRKEAELGPPSEAVPQMAGRFDGIYRTRVVPRKPKGGARSEDPGLGLYDMYSFTTALTHPVQKVRLYRDGTLRSESTNASGTAVLLRDVDEAGCADWKAGFRYGDVDGPIWHYFDEPGKAPAAPARLGVAPELLFAYYAVQSPPRLKAERSERVVKLDREATGFVRVDEMGFDLDGDGELDLMVLEGVGRGPGHLEGPTLTDDTWYRLLMANVGGAWKILEKDAFSYGCGC